MSLNRKQTHQILHHELPNAYKLDNNLCKYLDDGYFVYVDEMLVLNDPLYVAYNNGKPLLTELGHKELSTCALSFDVIQLTFPSKKNHFGNKTAFQTKTLTTGKEVKTPSMSDFFERQKIIYPFINSIQGLSSWEMIKSFLDFIKQEKIIYRSDEIGSESDIFCNRTNLGEFYYKRIIGEMERSDEMKKEAIVAFAAGYELYADMAEIFLKAAGVTFTLRSHDDVCHRLVLNTMTQSPIEVKNDELRKYRAKLLGTKSREEASKKTTSI